MTYSAIEEREAREQGEAEYRKECAALNRCLFCGEGRTANPWCTGDQAGGWADTCEECDGTGEGEAVIAPNAGVLTGNTCQACGAVSLTWLCPKCDQDWPSSNPVEETRAALCPFCGSRSHAKMCAPLREALT